jgi:NAD(P)-dependent dehydrogenase (short-subunit alcohol dehydrogenase family)
MSGFGAESTTDEVLDGVDLTGRWALVTGASAGLGQETARALAAHGASVVLGVRDPAKGESAAVPIREAAAAGGGDVELRAVDLASLASVRAFCDSMLADHDELALLIANAGVMACPESKTADGFEMQLGTNHLGHFVLVNRLVPLLLAASPSRVVCLTSAGHRFADVDLDDPAFEHTPYNPWVAYGRSKTANVLFAVELDRRLRADGVRACAVHPGGIMTELGRHLT